jgi:hypothetical protein
MKAAAANYDRAMVPLLASLGAATPEQPSPADASWQEAAENLFESSRNVEMLSSRLLGVARGEKANENLPAELLSAVSDLRARLDQNQRLLAR